jgi:GT2 family glycosyltransferase
VISIVIPTYTNYKGLVRCLESVKKYSSGDYEVIVVANGAPEETRPLSTLWFDQPLGFARAVNEGIKASKGEYVVLLNDDCVILPQNVNEWLENLKRPFDA